MYNMYYTYEFYSKKCCQLSLATIDTLNVQKKNC